LNKCIGADHERTGPQLNQGGERRIDFAARVAAFRQGLPPLRRQM
jgi:hypothetical protein